jgi:hypothetical protein
MASAVDILIRLRQAREAARDADRVARSVKGVGTSARQAGRDAQKGERGILSLRKAALGLGAVSAGAAAGGLYAFGRGARFGIAAAVDLGEEINKARVVFRSGAEDVLRFSETSATGLGISQRAALQAASNFGGLFKAVGVGADRADDMSIRLVQLAADLASFNNATPEEALDALRSGLSGETEPLRRFQVFLSAARIEQEALNSGLARSKEDIDETVKAQASYQLILKQTKDAQGDFTRTSDSLANRQRTLRAQVEDLSASLSAGAIPGLEGAAGAASRFLEEAQAIVDNDILTKAGQQDALVKLARETFVPIGRDVADGIAQGIDEHGDEILNALGKTAVDGAQRFAGAFVSADAYGQLFVLAILAKRLGVFGLLGSLAAGRFRGGFARSNARNPLPLAGGPIGAAATAGVAATAVTEDKLGIGTRGIVPEVLDRVLPPSRGGPRRRGRRDGQSNLERSRRRGEQRAEAIPGTGRLPDRGSPFRGFRARADTGRGLQFSADLQVPVNLDGVKVGEGIARVQVRRKDRGG